MASKHDQKSKPVRSNDHTPKGALLGFYPGYHAERKAAERKDFIADLNNTVKQARLLAGELVKGEQATYIVEYMVAKYYVMSIQSDRNIAAAFVDVRNEAIAELADYDVTHGFLRYATNQAFNALRGGYNMTKYGEGFDSALAAIRKRNEEFQQKRMRQLVDA